MASRTATTAASLLSPALRSIRPRVCRAWAASSQLQASTHLIRHQTRHLQPNAAPTIITRAAHSIPRPPPIQPREPSNTTSDSEASASADADAPASEGERPAIQNPAYYQLSFTCVPCSHRSHHNVSKQGYHSGSVLITCPECRNRHVISDHLGIFGDRKITVEDLLREKGQLVKRGSLGEDGDIEFWPDERTAQDPAAALGDGSGQSRS